MPRGYPKNKNPKVYEEKLSLSEARALAKEEIKKVEWFGVLMNSVPYEMVSGWMESEQLAINYATDLTLSKREEKIVQGNMLIVKVVGKVNVYVKQEIVNV